MDFLNEASSILSIADGVDALDGTETAEDEEDDVLDEAPGSITEDAVSEGSADTLPEISDPFDVLDELDVLEDTSTGTEFLSGADESDFSVSGVLSVKYAAETAAVEDSGTDVSPTVDLTSAEEPVYAGV